MYFRRKSPIIASRKGEPMKYRKWDPKTKMQIVLEGLEGRTQLSEICNKYHITQSMFYYWVKELQANGHKIFESIKESKKEQRLKEEVKKLKAIIAELSIELKKTELELQEGGDL
jgi:transposase-like protein